MQDFCCCRSNYNTANNNTATQNGWGIVLNQSDHNSLSQNNASYNTYTGIDLSN